MKITDEHKRGGTCKVTINPAHEQAPQDIFKPGSLVKSKNILVLVTEGVPEEPKAFCGVYLSGNSEMHSTGDFRITWSKDSFVKFVGSILLEQE